MKLLGLGTDLIAVARIARSLERFEDRFAERIFTEKERTYCLSFGSNSPRHFAGRFAAKEACSKALGTGIRAGCTWHDIEILNDTQGKPIIIFSGNTDEEGLCFLCSISHCDDYASATVVAFKEQ